MMTDEEMVEYAEKIFMAGFFPVFALACFLIWG